MPTLERRETCLSQQPIGLGVFTFRKLLKMLESLFLIKPVRPNKINNLEPKPGRLLFTQLLRSSVDISASLPLVYVA